MPEQSQQIKIKCPHCGWIRKVEVQVTIDPDVSNAKHAINPGVSVQVTGEGRDTLQEIARKIQARLADPELAEADAWIEVAACPHCGNAYRYNVRTGEVERGEKA